MKKQVKSSALYLVLYKITCYCLTPDGNRLQFHDIVTGENWEDARKRASARFKKAGLLPVTGFRRDVLDVYWFN